MTATLAQDQGRRAAWAFPQSGRLAYIDGVRAVAILSVVAFHANVPGFSGGYVGVDVFFVISGFLITHQIVTQLLAGQFSAPNFYARRILRILPPLLLVTALTVAVAPMFPLLPNEARELTESAAATAAMVSNYYFSFDTGYFQAKTEIKPLLHTWSLGVEEQYYLLAPAIIASIVIIAARRRWNPVHALIFSGVLSIAIFYLALELLSIANSRLAFYSIMTRAWQFAAGGTLTFLTLKGLSLPERFRPALGIAGLLGIAVAVHFYDVHMIYPGHGAALLPTFATVLLLASGLNHRGDTLMQGLESRPVVAIGLVSYSWYLWHWPVTEFGRSLAIAPDSVWKDVAAASIALALAALTYMILEVPMRRLRRPEIMRSYDRRIVVGGIVGSALVATLTLTAGHSPSFQPHVAPIMADGPIRDVELCRRDGDFDFNRRCLVGIGTKPDVAFFGDSHAGLLSVAAWSAGDTGRTAAVVARPACPPLKGIEVEFWARPVCAFANNEMLRWLLSQGDHPVTGVVLAARWLFYEQREMPSREAELPRLLWSEPGHDRNDFDAMLTGSLGATIAALGPSRRVLVLGPTPELRRPPGGCLLRARLNGVATEICLADRAAVEQRRARVMRLLADVVGKFPNARLLDPIDAFCDREKCRTSGPSGPYYRDPHHLYPAGEEVLYQRFSHDFQWVYGRD